MVAIISSNSLGLSNSALDARGVFGSAQNGRSGEQVSVNIANGNLVLQDLDNFLAGHQSISSVRTYNSQGLFNDDNGDNWSNGFYRQQIQLASGTLNTEGSTLLRTERDGAQALYTWNSTKNLYVSTDGSDAYDTIRYTTGPYPWYTYTNGATRETFTYNAAGRITQTADPSGNTSSYSYNAQGLLEKISNSDNSNGKASTTLYDYTGTRLDAIRTESNGLNQTVVNYLYDGFNRLEKVLVNLNPENQPNLPNGNYVTTYGYDGASKRIASITQTDGSVLGFSWVTTSDGKERVASVTDALGQKTSFGYNLASNITSVTDPLGLTSTYQYDANGQLVEVKSPAVDGSRKTTHYDYNAQGDLLKIGDLEGHSTTYTYDANGNQLSQTDAAGNTVTSVYDAVNQLARETHYTIAATSSTPASGGVTTYYMRDNQSRVRFIVNNSKHVTEYRYNPNGERNASIVYANPITTTFGSVADLATWAAAQNSSQTQRTDYAYDFRGLLKTSTQYGTLDAQGNGISDEQTSVTHYIFDQSARLLQTITPLGSALKTSNPNLGSTVYAYDGLGRVLLATDALGNATITRYDDANAKTTVQLADQSVTISEYDRAGRLTSQTRRESESSSNLAQSQFKYDANNRLVQSIGPTGTQQTILYDDAGRRAATIDGHGAITEYFYNDAGQLLRSIQRATPLAAEVLSALLANPANARLAGSQAQDQRTPGSNPLIISSVASNNDRISRQILDLAGRVVKTIDALGAVVTNQYDGMSNLTQSVASYKLLSASQLSSLAFKEADHTLITASDADTLVSATPNDDRPTTRYYDKDGRLIGLLDSDNYLTEYQYNTTGQLVLSHRYYTRRYNRPNTLTPPPYDANDIRSVNLYNHKGQLAAQVDGENYLTRYTYDNNGNLSKTQRFATKIVGVVQVSTALDDPMLQVATDVADQTSTTTWNALNQMQFSINAEGTRTDYQYDSVGNMIASFTSSVSEAEGGIRGNDRHFDILGRVIAELNGEGSRLLHSGSHTQSEIDAIWQQYGIKYTYDAAGHRTSVTDANQHSTLYYYNDLGQLSTTINAAGEVELRSYTVQGELASQNQLSTRIAPAALALLVANTLQNTQPRTTPVISSDATNDSRQSFAYDVRGQLSLQTDALGSPSTYEYNSFGELSRERHAILQNGSSFISNETSYKYDTRGLRYSTSRINNKNGSDYQLTGDYTLYDAFGRASSVRDFLGNYRTFNYDRLGHTITLTDPLQTTRRSYDAFDRIMSETDGLGNTTTTHFNTANRSITITTAESVSFTTINNRYGQKASVSDANGKVTHYDYNGSGQLVRVSDEFGTSIDNHYDGAGLLTYTIDGRGTYTTFEYDAANRVLTKTVDPTTLPGGQTRVGLNLQTRYSYDAKGLVLTVTDPKGVVTATRYDAKGQVKSVSIDPDGMNLTTLFGYDLLGQTISVTQPNGVVTLYEYDKLGRRIKQTGDYTPSSSSVKGLNLITQYFYDNNNNLIQTIAPNGARTTRVYDVQNRLTDVIDAEGGVNRTQYDAAGRVSARISYARAITLPAAPTVLTSATLAPLIRADIERDVVTYLVYDKDSRVRFSIDGSGSIEELRYDGN
ncbi:MAG: hypothetical protein RL748_301, partial [Pseudomonadota bacterium]